VNFVSEVASAYSEQVKNLLSFATRHKGVWASGSKLPRTLKADSDIACRAHAVPLPCRAVNSHIPCRSPALLRQSRVLREIPRGSRKYPNC